MFILNNATLLEAIKVLFLSRSSNGPTRKFYIFDFGLSMFKQPFVSIKFSSSQILSKTVSRLFLKTFCVPVGLLRAQVTVQSLNILYYIELLCF